MLAEERFAVILEVLQRRRAATVAPLDRACIITDALPDKSYAKHAIIKEAEPL